MARKQKPKDGTFKSLLKYELHVIGHWLFLLGIALSVVFGLTFSDNGYVASILVVLGIVVGLLNVKANETHQFLLAALVLMVSAQTLKFVPLVGEALLNVLEYIVILVAPAAAIISLLAIRKLASGK
jgi:hypothetical protein